jgi:hypothetical protein
MMPRLATSTLTATIALALAIAPRADAASMTSAVDPVQTYFDSISGAVSGPSNGPIRFLNPLNLSPFTTPGSITLGQFVTNPLPYSASLTYDNTPFQIDVSVGRNDNYGMYPNYSVNPNNNTYRIAGVLNGTLGGHRPSTMTATVTNINPIDAHGLGQPSTMPLPALTFQISPQVIAAPNDHSDQNEGYTTLTAQVAVVGVPLPAPAPEPSTVAVFGLALAGWAFRRYRRKGAEG